CGSSIASMIFDSIKKHNGSIVNDPSEKTMAFFIDAADAVASSIEIADHLETLEGKVIFSIALSSGKPVDEQGSVMFEKTKLKVNLLSRLGFQMGICMDLDTRRSASRNTAFSDNVIKRLTVVDEP